eukprot:2788925-Alexandrium_andersonii.AAC.1
MIADASLRILDSVTSGPLDFVFVGGFGICARSGMEGTDRELRAPILRLFLRPRSSSSECLKQVCMLRMADCGLGQTAALEP